jgi:hypothetical protein
VSINGSVEKEDNVMAGKSDPKLDRSSVSRRQLLVSGGLMAAGQAGL